MTVTLSAAEVLTFTGSVVTADEISLASSLIDEQTGYTPSEHADERGIPSLSVQAAWALVAVRVHRMMTGDDTTAVTSETQGDYSYNEDATLARSFKWSNVTDGRPHELLNLSRARWVHI